MSLVASTVPDTERLAPAQGKRLLTIGAAIAVVGIVLSAIAAFTDKERFAFSYLTAFLFVLTLGLGALFFIQIQHVVKAGWSVGPRRQAEWLSGIIPLTIILFVPIVFLAQDIWHHWMNDHWQDDALLVQKRPYLNPTFFYIRAAIYFAVWAALSWFFNNHSARQDVDGDPNRSLKMSTLSAPGLVLSGLTITFAGFDWLMSLDPHWFSTIFGVYVFAGAFVAALAAISLMMIALQRAKVLGRVSTVEHRHDIGKLLFGFTVFWAYIAFSQFFLIWYSNIPEETIYFLHRWEGSWKHVSMALLFGHFVVPFLLLLPRTTKRSYLGLTVGAVIILVMHYVDLYWMVMPTLDTEGARFTWIDVATLLATVGVLLAWLGYRASRDNLYPLKDPRLAEAVQVVNL